VAKKVVLFAQPPNDAVKALFGDQVEMRIASSPEPAVVAKEIKGAHGLFVRLSKTTAELIAAGDQLQVIGRTGVGLDNIDVPAATKHGVAVVFTPDANTISVAEYVVGSSIALARQYCKQNAEVRKGNWAVREQYVRELHGCTFGFIGLGRIGSLAAHKCQGAFDAKTIAYDPYLTPERAKAMGVELVGTIEEVLRTADVVSIHVPLTKETTNLIGAKELAMMKPTAYLISAARGSIVDEAALADALKNSVIAGAAVDVFGQEPPAADNPLYSAPNSILTPHTAALTHEAMDRVYQSVVADMLAVLNGQTPKYAANPEVLKK